MPITAAARRTTLGNSRAGRYLPYSEQPDRGTVADQIAATRGAVGGGLTYGGAPGGAAGATAAGTAGQGAIPGLASGLDAGNESILGGYTELEGEVTGSLEGLGAADMAGIDRYEQERSAEISQDHISRGLGNTTAPDSKTTGVGREAEEMRMRARENATLRETDAVSSIRGARLGAEERRTPDYRAYMDLARGEGEAEGTYSGAGRPGASTGPVGPVTGDSSGGWGATAPANTGGTQGYTPPATASQNAQNRLATAVKQMFGVDNWGDLSPAQQDQFRRWAQENMRDIVRYLPAPSASGGGNPMLGDTSSGGGYTRPSGGYAGDRPGTGGSLGPAGRDAYDSASGTFYQDENGVWRQRS